MNRLVHRLFICFILTKLPLASAVAADIEAKPDDPYFAQFNPRRAPHPGPLLLRTNDRLSIIGDSITEAKGYSRIMEIYLTVCTPELKLDVRQAGWSGEMAEGFRKRIQKDCLPFKPTIATLCYGMNDSLYRPYDDANGASYASNYTAVVKALQEAGARVVVGSPGCAGKLPPWGKGTWDELNISLCRFRDLGLAIAEKENARFADVFWPMLQAAHYGRQRYGITNAPFNLAGPDGIHPNASGHLVMAYAFLKALGVSGEIGTFTVDLSANRAEATAGHRVDSFAAGALTITSSRYPFCDAGETNKDSSIRAGMTLCPFNRELNRLMLVVKNPGSPRCKITWGPSTRIYRAEELAAGINLADDFALNPFSEAFKRVNDAVAVKQKYDTTQIRVVLHGNEGRRNWDAAFARSEGERARLAGVIAETFVPVQHTLRIEPVQ